MKQYILACCSLLLPIWALGQSHPVAQSLPYSQDFSGVLHTATTFPDGWQGWTLSTAPGSSFNTAAPVSDRSLVAGSSAAVTSGNMHNYDGKIGFLNTGSLDLSLLLAVNTSDKKNISVRYDIMTIRNPYDSASNTRINEVALQYRIGTSGTFTTLGAAYYQNTTERQTTTGSTTPQHLETKTIILPAECDSEAVVQLRWVSRQLSGSGGRPSFAIDRIHVDTAALLTDVVRMATVQHAHEGSTPVPGSILCSFSPAPATALSFDYAVSGSAILGTDYTLALASGGTPSALKAISGTITVPAGRDTISVLVLPLDDTLREGPETIRFSLTAAPTGYTLADSVAVVRLMDDESTPIHLIQGSGLTASAGTYTVEGIVTGVYPTLSPAGFYLQEEDADADADDKTSEGIFIVSALPFHTGDKVRVSGTVQENSSAPSYNQAVLVAASVLPLATGVPLPTAAVIRLPLSDTSDYERYEGMLIRFDDTLTVTDNYGLSRYGELGLAAGGVLYQPSQIVDPNDATASGTTASGASNLAALNDFILQQKLRSILLDDGRGTLPDLPYVNTEHTVRIGSRIGRLEGVLGYAYSKYRIQPLSLDSIRISYAARPAVPGIGAADVRIASFNVLNYFNGDGSGGGFPTERGAHSAAEFSRQRDKIITALLEIDAAVVGLIEIENDGTGPLSAIQDLVNGLNAKAGAGTYAVIDDGASVQAHCTDAIRCGMIYQPAIVQPEGSALIGSDTVFNRPPLAQSFRLTATDSSFSYIINHFKSKGCSGATGADLDQLDGQSCYNHRRQRQAAALVRFIQSELLPVSGTPNVLSMGDYNAYFEEDPLDSIRNSGFTVLSDAHSYSYLFNGMMGALDNAFVSSALNTAVTGVAKWQINSAEPTSLDYNDLVDDGGTDVINPWGGTYRPDPFRSSDHDPVLVGLRLPARVGLPGDELPVFRCYPNPAATELQLQYTSAYPVVLKLMNTMGQELQCSILEAGTGTRRFDIGNLPSGLYLLRMTSAAGTRVQQVLHQ